MRQSSNNAIATTTNIRFGSLEFPELWWNVNAIEIPTISLDTPRHNTRAGASSTMAADTCTYTDLNLEIILDKEWKTYDEIYDFFLEGLNVETAKFSHYKKFELWVEFVDGQGQVRKKFLFHSCRLQELGGIIAAPNDDEDTPQVLSLGFSILYYTHDKLNPFLNMKTIPKKECPLNTNLDEPASVPTQVINP